MPVQKAHAWHSTGTLDTVVFLVIAGVAVVVVPPAYLTYKTYKLVKDKTTSIKNHFFAHHDDEAYITPEQAAEKIAKAQALEAVESFLLQTNNLLNARTALLHDKDSAFLTKMVSYLEKVKRELPSEDTNLGSLFCWFRETFLPDEEHIDPQTIKDWFVALEKTSLVPHAYLNKIQATFKLSDYSSRYLFTRAYMSLKNAGFAFDRDLPIK